MVATTIVAATCAWVAHNAALVRQRQTMREVLRAKRDPCFREEWCMVERREQPLPWLRQVFGDEPLRALLYTANRDPDGSELRRMRSIFPEAEIVPRQK